MHDTDSLHCGSLRVHGHYKGLPPTNGIRREDSDAVGETVGDEVDVSVEAEVDLGDRKYGPDLTSFHPIAGFRQTRIFSYLLYYICFRSWLKGEYTLLLVLKTEFLTFSKGKE